jgi:hypothetical protein
MNFELDNDFVGVFTEVYPEGYCSHVINEFEKYKAEGAGSNRIHSENAPPHFKDDYQLSFIHASNLRVSPFLIGDEELNPVNMFFTGLQNCLDIYTQKYSVLKQSEIKTQDMKLQKTSPGGGYHVWHAEQGNTEPRRILTFMLYLNTLDEEDGGETEFLYQRRRIRPVENTMLLWPAAYTHAHRGNTVLGTKDKYIATGWFHLV